MNIIYYRMHRWMYNRTDNVTYLISTLRRILIILFHHYNCFFFIIWVFVWVFVLVCFPIPQYLSSFSLRSLWLLPHVLWRWTIPTVTNVSVLRIFVVFLKKSLNVLYYFIILIFDSNHEEFANFRRVMNIPWRVKARDECLLTLSLNQ